MLMPPPVAIPSPSWTSQILPSRHDLLSNLVVAFPPRVLLRLSCRVALLRIQSNVSFPQHKVTTAHPSAY